jgi:hypothetical protein
MLTLLFGQLDRVELSVAITRQQLFLNRALRSFAELKRDFPDRFGDDWWSSEILYQDSS